MKVTDIVTEFAKPIVEANGCSLWDVEYVREGSERFLRLYIDKAGAEDAQSCIEQMRCDTAAECLAGALYAALSSPEDFDGAMILSVNHSGRSAAVGALTGAILGAKLGAEALPDFYLESLEAADILEQLARDLALGSPTAGLFDDDWDHKYTQGLPVGQY